MDNVIAFPKAASVPDMLRMLAEQTEEAIGLVYIFHTDGEYFAGSMGNVSDLDAVGLASIATRFFQNEAALDD